MESVITFKEGLVQEIMKLHFTDNKLKISNDAVTSTNEVMDSFLQEIVWRCTNQASNEGLTTVNLDHLEKILPQLLLDFA